MNQTGNETVVIKEEFPEHDEPQPASKRRKREYGIITNEKLVKVSE